MRHGSLPLAFFAAALLATGLAHAEGLAGTYAADPGAQQTIEKAIEAGIADMNFIQRPIARSRLKSTNPAYRAVAISRTATEITVTFDARKPVSVPADGSAVRWTREDGESFDVSATWQDALLVERFKGEDGARENAFGLGPDGTLLTLTVTLTSPRLKAPVRYTVSFHRVEDK